MRRIRYRQATMGEEEVLCDVVLRAFGASVAPDYSREGVEEFRRYARPEELRRRLAEGEMVLVAEAAGSVVGVVELRGRRHISMLFVDPSVQNRGVGSELLRRAVAWCRESESGEPEITVHAAPSAVPFYRGHGFRPRGRERIENGIRYTPMALPVVAG